MDLHRYQKQLILPEIGLTGQKKLSEARVLCVGAGGLGCPVLLYLTAAGIGTIGIIDGDTVDLSNVQRQVLYKACDVGNKKVYCAQKTLKELNQQTKINSYDEYLSIENCLELFSEYDVIVDGTDNFITKYLINDCARKVSIPVIYASVSGFHGQACIFDGKPESACFRCLYPEPPLVSVRNCAESGILGSVVGQLGLIQSLQAIYTIVGEEHCKRFGIEPLLGKLWVNDFKSMQSQIFNIPKISNCEICSVEPKKIMLKKVEINNCAKGEFDLFPNDILGFTGVIIDVREKDERIQYIEKSIHIPYSTIKKTPEILNALGDKNEKYLVYCKSGWRSNQVLQQMKSLSFNYVYNLYGGYDALAA